MRVNETALCETQLTHPANLLYTALSVGKQYRSMKGKASICHNSLYLPAVGYLNGRVDLLISVLSVNTFYRHVLVLIIIIVIPASVYCIVSMYRNGLKCACQNVSRRQV